MNPTKGLRCIDWAQFFMFITCALEISLVFISGDYWTNASIIIALLVAVFSIISVLLEVAGVWRLRKININFTSARVVVIIYLFIAIFIVVSEAFKYSLDGFIIAIYLMYCFRIIARFLVIINVTDGTNKIVNIQDTKLVEKGVRVKKCFLITSIIIVLCYFYAIAIETYDIFADNAQMLENTVYFALLAGLIIKTTIHIQYLTYINSAYKLFKVQ